MIEEDVIDEFESFDIEFSDDADLIEQEEMIRDFRKFYRLVDNFLNNLSKNPDASTLKWPNRARDIKEFRKVMMALATGYMDRSDNE